MAAVKIAGSDVDQGSEAAVRIAKASTVASHAAGSRQRLASTAIVQSPAMAVTGGLIYYSVPASSGFAIRTVPVPAACG